MTSQTADDIDAKMRWAKVNITEILEGMEELSWEQRGFYCTAIFKMYARMGGIPSDKVEGARVMRCDVRFFSRLRDELIARGKLHDTNGLISNNRVEREITEFVKEARRRRDAALEREERRRRGQDLLDFAGTSPELPGEVGETFSQSPADFQENFDRNANENNGGDTRAVARGEHNSAHNQNQNQNHTSEVKTNMPTEGVGLDEDPVKGPKVYPAEFETFWKAFPVKQGKSSAFKSWKRLSPADRKRAIAAAPLYAARLLREKIDKPKWGQGWLTDGRFNDELDAAPSATTTFWWQKPEKLASVTHDQWEQLINKHANGTWPIDKLGWPPAHDKHVVPDSVIRSMDLLRRYDIHGINKETKAHG